MSISKSDVEKELKEKGDFVKIDHLTRLLEGNISRDVKSFIYLKLAELYEKKSIFTESAKMFNKIALNSITFADKIKFHTKEAEMYVKAGNFKKVDDAVKKAMSEANANQRAEINFNVREFYKRQAEIYEKELKRNHAVKVYEKLLETTSSEIDKRMIKKKLLGLYEKLGRLKEYFVLKKSLDEYCVE